MQHTTPPPTATGEPAPPSPGFALYFAFFGGGIAWTIQLLGAYLIAEFGCLSNTGQTQHLGIAGLTWSLAIVSALMLALAAAAALTGYLALRHLQRKHGIDEQGTMNDEPEPSHRSSFIVHRSLNTRIHFARAGAIMSAIFALVIVCQSIPIFFYLRGC